MKNTLLFVLLLGAAASSAFANIADPSLGKTKSIDTRLHISIDGKAKEAKLIIPRSQLRQLRAELDAVDGGSDSTATAGISLSGTQTIVSGALLSAAFIFAGLWFVRSGSKPRGAVVAGAGLLTLASVATIVYGNAGPPPEARVINGKMFTQAVHMYKQGSGPIKLEVSDKVDTPELIVPDSVKLSEE
ncbi:MAG TPA: hypothetical protein VJV05_17410 [Pyrinomonadaceae bacterium]|nr:hypothetical protein [Pyrinomonadaceae bacterium]